MAVSFFEAIMNLIPKKLRKPVIELNEQFTHALDLMENTQQCLFITGKAGTGKSTLLTHFCKTTRKKPVVLAPTGVAALNVKGQTIHRFFHFYVDVTPQKILDKKSKPRDARLYKKLKTIVIDEVSMVRADLLDCIDVFLRMYGPDNTQPFGGVQMIFVGDLYQLPPVVSSTEREVFSHVYPSPFFFSANAMQSLPLELIELDTIYRQKDADFVQTLNRIRNNSATEDDLDLLNTRFLDATQHTTNHHTIYLTTTNRKADEINDTALRSLSGEMHQFEAQVKGKFDKEYFPTSTLLEFKVGSQIMMLNNDTADRWVNGSIGIIKNVGENADGEACVRIQLSDDNEVVEVIPHQWEVYRFMLEGAEIVSEAVGTFTQMPFRLAWAITIHKSQGKTFDDITIDLDKGTFAAGQMYVALSRCTSLEGITLRTRIRPEHIRTDYRIIQFLTRMRYAKADETMPIEQKMAMIQHAIDSRIHLQITYLKANDTQTERVVIPSKVGIEHYQGKAFPGMKATCTLRKEHRMFHVGRILSMSFADEQ
jgi:ATP-dependent DNA helicase PIF1